MDCTLVCLGAVSAFHWMHLMIPFLAVRHVVVTVGVDKINK